MRPLFQENSISRRIMAVVHLTGELPYRALRFMGTSKTSSMECARMLVKKGYLIEEKPFRNGRTLILGKKLMETEPFYLAEEVHKKNLQTIYYRNKNKDAYTRRVRNMYMAETLALLWEAKIEILPDLKADLNYETIKQRDVCFYMSKEVKELMSKERARASASRSLGILIVNYQMSLVYHLGMRLPTINLSTERTSRDRIESILNLHCDYQIKHKKPTLMNSVYMLTYNYHALYMLITGKKKKKSERIQFVFDDTFLNYYLLPCDRSGIKVLQMMTAVDGIELLRSLVFKPSEQQRKGTGRIDCDGIKEDGTVAFNFMVPDARRLKNFINGVSIQKRASEPIRACVYCFVWQEPALREVIDENIKIVAFSTDKVFQLFWENYKGGIRVQN